MKVNGKHYTAIWLEENIVKIIDQRWLPHRFVVEELVSINDFYNAIKDMHVRGAPLIGATAAYGMMKAFELGRSIEAAKILVSARPTAIDLSWAATEMMKAKDAEEAKVLAQKIYRDYIKNCRLIGEHGIKLIEHIAQKKEKVNILTHCNAGWLATVDYGTATAPIYAAHDKGINVHVWVDETRPRNQGARLTAWELEQHGVPCTVIVDNTGGHLMQKGMVDMVIIGSDRTTHTGYVCNKIGTYLKALAAKDNGIPFYAALPYSTIDWETDDGNSIPIEKRDAQEVKYIQGDLDGEIKKVLLTPKDSKAANFAFDVTPPRLVTKIITEKGICSPTDIKSLYHNIKFECKLIKKDCISSEIVDEINNCRQKLIKLNMLGEHDGIGFGNISIKKNDKIFITGSNTGGIKTLKKEHISEISHYDLENNMIMCCGLIKASSESLSHIAVYEENSKINAVIHAHDNELWNMSLPSVKGEYGTVELAKNIKEKTLYNPEQIMKMIDHEDGVIAYGIDLNSAFSNLVKYKNHKNLLQ